jgi:hypothetical protein
MAGHEAASFPGKAERSAALACPCDRVNAVIRSIIPPLFCLVAAGGAYGQVQTSMDDEMRARLIGVLDRTRLSVEFDGLPARAAFRAIAAALRTTIIVHYATDEGGAGIDPESPVTLQVAESPARLVLESIVEQCALYDPCTWQLRSGYVEVGTRDRLGVRGAAETRPYNLRDLMLEAPYFENAPIAGFGGLMFGVTPPAYGAGDEFEEHPYSCAALSRPAPQIGGVARKRPEALIVEIAEGMIEVIEPGNWDYGQEDQNDDSELARNDHIAGPWQAAPPSPGGKIARIRVWQDTLVIVAPDYVHRQIGGYPKPIPPAPLSEDERRERSTKASADGGHVVIHPIQGPGGAAGGGRP